LARNGIPAKLAGSSAAKQGACDKKEPPKKPIQKANHFFSYQLVIFTLAYLF